MALCKSVCPPPKFNILRNDHRIFLSSRLLFQGCCPYDDAENTMCSCSYVFHHMWVTRKCLRCGKNKVEAEMRCGIVKSHPFSKTRLYWLPLCRLFLATNMNKLWHVGSVWLWPWKSTVDLRMMMLYDFERCLTEFDHGSWSYMLLEALHRHVQIFFVFFWFSEYEHGWAFLRQGIWQNMDSIKIKKICLFWLLWTDFWKESSDGLQ